MGTPNNLDHWITLVDERLLSVRSRLAGVLTDELHRQPKERRVMPVHLNYRETATHWEVALWTCSATDLKDLQGIWASVEVPVSWRLLPAKDLNKALHSTLESLGNDIIEAILGAHGAKDKA